MELLDKMSRPEYWAGDSKINIVNCDDSYIEETARWLMITSRFGTSQEVCSSGQLSPPPQPPSLPARCPQSQGWLGRKTIHFIHVFCSEFMGRTTFEPQNQGSGKEGRARGDTGREGFVAPDPATAKNDLTICPESGAYTDLLHP